MDKFSVKIRGSYTVEMAMISGVWLFVIFASLMLIIGTYERAYDTAVCCEAAVCGETEAVRRTGDGLRKARKRLEPEQRNYVVFGSKRELTVIYSNYTEIPFGGLQWKWKKSIKNKVVRPVLFIEGIQRARKFQENIGN